MTTIGAQCGRTGRLAALSRRLAGIGMAAYNALLADHD
jgi:hypothetical protein